MQVSKKKFCKKQKNNFSLVQIYFFIEEINYSYFEDRTIYEKKRNYILYNIIICKRTSGLITVVFSVYDAFDIV